MRSRRKEGKHRNRWPLLYGVLLTLYAVYTLLEAFVIPSSIVRIDELEQTGSYAEGTGENADSDAETASGTEETAETASGTEESVVITATSYSCEAFTIVISTIREYDTAIYIADITVSSAEYLQTALAGGVFGRNVTDTTSDISEENDAVLAINGDYYGFRTAGYVMRNGYLYRASVLSSDQEDLVIYGDGSMEIICEGDVSAEALAAAGAMQIFSFGPGLVSGGAVTVDESTEVDRSKSSNPRTAIGQIGTLHYVFVVSDGRTDESEGLSLLQLAQVMAELGCVTAYNLDGGGSSTMWFNGEIVNNPTSGRHSGGERSISDIVYIGA